MNKIRTAVVACIGIGVIVVMGWAMMAQLAAPRTPAPAAASKVVQCPPGTELKGTLCACPQGSRWTGEQCAISWPAARKVADPKPIKQGGVIVYPISMPETDEQVLPVPPNR